MIRAGSETSLHELRPIHILLCSCGHAKSEHYCKELEEHLGSLKRQGPPVVIEQSFNLAKTQELVKSISKSNILVLCINSSLLDSDNYYAIIDLSARLCSEGRLRALPIFMDYADYKAVPFLNEVQVLPRGDKPLSGMVPSERNKVYVEIVQAIRGMIQDLQVCLQGEKDVVEEEIDEETDSNNPSFYIARGNRFFQSQHYNKALVAYNRALSLDPESIDGYRARAELYFKLALLNLEKGKQLSDQSDDTAGLHVRLALLDYEKVKQLSDQSGDIQEDLQ